MQADETDPSARRLELTEQRRVPWDGLLLGWGAMLPLAVCAGVAWVGDAALAAGARAAAAGWGAALLIFFSGVRRGLSFRTEGGPTVAQLVGFGLLFLLGVAVALLPATAGLALLTATFAVLGFADRQAARRGEAPLYFIRLRPWQMAFATACAALCAAAP